MAASPLSSFVEVPAGSPFSLQNIPFGVFCHVQSCMPRVGTRIGDTVLDLGALATAGLFTGPILSRHGDVFCRPVLNGFMALGRPAWQEARQTIQSLLRADNPTLRDNHELRSRALIAVHNVQMHLPAAIGDYTDFSSSRYHAHNVGTMFRGPDNALMENWLHMPVAYHGRASSIVVSGQDIHRPAGQIKPGDRDRPIFGPSRRLDFELEVGFFTGPGNQLGEPIPVQDARDHIFGLVLVNDWSARDIQTWEYRPLGPFLAKNFATSISPWVVTLDALEPFLVEGPRQEPEPLPYLQSTGRWGYDIDLEVQLQSAQMGHPVVISRSNFRHLYWNMAQQLAHHTITGCNVRPGDLLATGTISGPTPDSLGSLLELSWQGTKPLTLPNGETRTYLADGDRVTLTGRAQGDDYCVGFGEVSARILPCPAS
jgi:fumarylacetoacetase